MATTLKNADRANSSYLQKTTFPCEDNYLSGLKMEHKRHKDMRVSRTLLACDPRQLSIRAFAHDC